MSPTQEQKDNWHNNPSNWKWGGIYYNTEDPRIVVDKKAKWMGVTFNFGNKKGVFWFVILMVIILAWGLFLLRHIK